MVLLLLLLDLHLDAHDPLLEDSEGLLLEESEEFGVLLFGKGQTDMQDVLAVLEGGVCDELGGEQVDFAVDFGVAAEHLRDRWGVGYVGDVLELLALPGVDVDWPECPVEEDCVEQGLEAVDHEDGLELDG